MRYSIICLLRRFLSQHPHAISPELLRKHDEGFGIDRVMVWLVLRYYDIDKISEPTILARPR